MRHTASPFFFAVLFLLGVSDTASSANLVGDADNDGFVDSVDAALVQARVLGIVDEWAISPFALADNDGDLDLADIMLVAQAANGTGTVVGPGGWLAISEPPNSTTESGLSSFPIFWGVFTAYNGVAEMTDGIVADVEQIPDSAESTISLTAPVVSGFAALTVFTPVNSTGSPEFHNLRLNIVIQNSLGSHLDTIASNTAILVGPSICGNNFTQPGEDCDEGTSPPASDCGCQADCTLIASGTSCQDGDPCLADKECDGSGNCAMGTPYSCDDGIGCTFDSCDHAGGCSNVVNSGTCLISGTCYSSSDPNPSNPCQLCDASSDQNAWSSYADGTLCDADSNGCTIDDHCMSGVCVQGYTATCFSDLNECTDDSCGSTGPDSYYCPYFPVPDEEPCSDGLNCTGPDLCWSGVCFGLVACDDGNQCTNDYCDISGECAWDVQEGNVCTDNDSCTLSDICQADATCQGTQKDCDDMNPCTADNCNPSTGQCENPTNPEVCGDGAMCGIEVCDDGLINGSRNRCNINCNGLCDPTHTWSKSLGGIGGDYIKSVAFDFNGNIVVTGKFIDVANLGGSPLTSAGLEDIYLAKFDSSGNHLWSQRFGESDYDEPNSVKTDSMGNIIITGHFNSNTIDFGGGNLTSAGGGDVFIAKFNPDGGHIWSYNYGDLAFQTSQNVAVDGFDNIILTGMYWSSVDFGGGLMTSTGVDVFIAKFDPNGTLLWSSGFGASTEIETYGDRSLAIDRFGNIIIAGDFIGLVDFGGGPIDSGGDGRDIFVAYFDPSGTHLWSQGFGDVATTDQLLKSVTVDNNNRIIMTGLFQGSIDFGGGLLASAGSSDVYLAKLDSLGNHLWSQSFGDSSAQSAWSVVSDGSENVIITGQYQGSVDFGGGVLTSDPTSDDIFLAAFDTSGNHLWSQSFGDTQPEYGRVLALDDEGNVLLGGHYSWGSLDFGGGPITSAGEYDGYIAKFTPDFSIDCFQCGDTFIDPGETCDDGDTDICTANCNGTCSGPENQCGDGRVRCGEICDDGNLIPGDGCNEFCSGL